MECAPLDSLKGPHAPFPKAQQLCAPALACACPEAVTLCPWWQRAHPFSPGSVCCAWGALAGGEGSAGLDLCGGESRECSEPKAGLGSPGWACHPATGRADAAAVRELLGALGGRPAGCQRPPGGGCSGLPQLALGAGLWDPLGARGASVSRDACRPSRRFLEALTPQLGELSLHNPPPCTQVLP